MTSPLFQFREGPLTCRRGDLSIRTIKEFAATTASGSAAELAYCFFFALRRSLSASRWRASSPRELPRPNRGNVRGCGTSDVITIIRIRSARSRGGILTFASWWRSGASATMPMGLIDAQTERTTSRSPGRGGRSAPAAVVLTLALAAFAFWPRSPWCWARRWPSGARLAGLGPVVAWAWTLLSPVVHSPGGRRNRSCTTSPRRGAGWVWVTPGSV